MRTLSKRSVAPDRRKKMVSSLKTQGMDPSKTWANILCKTTKLNRWEKDKDGDGLKHN